MELEEALQKFIQEENYLSETIKKLDGLSDYPDLVEYLSDIKQLIKKLKVKKKDIKENISEITDELLSVAEAYSIDCIEEN